MAGWGKEKEREEKEDSKIRDMATVIGLMVSILVAGTVLYSNVEKVPSWWFYFSFIFLVALAFFMPCVIFFKPISKKYKGIKLKRKQDSIFRKYFSEFKNIADTSRKFNYTIKDIFSSLRTHYSSSSQFSNYVMQSYEKFDSNDIEGMFYNIENEVNKPNITFHDFCLLMKYFESIINLYEKNLKIIEEFAHEIMNIKGEPIAKSIEDDFEHFREQYNDFIRELKKFCNKINQEIGEIKFHEHVFHQIKKW